MAYTTYSEVTADFKDVTFDSSSNVKSADVTQFIVEADELINAYVGSRYTVPVAAGSGLNLLKLLSRSLVTARIKKILEVKSEKNTDASQSIVGVLMPPKDVMKMLVEIRDGDILLNGATSLSSGGGFYSKNVVEDIEPVIEKDEKQW